MILCARFVVPIDQPPIRDGAIRLEDGIIQEMGKRRDKSGEPSHDYGDAAIVPGFVNAHTHLELSSLHKQVPPTSDFTDWLRRLAKKIAPEGVDRSTVEKSVRLGVAQSLAYGVTTVGDITRNPDRTRAVLVQSPIKAISFGEIIAIGSCRHLLVERLEAAASKQHESARLHIGISPHAPYTVEPDALRACAARSHNQELPIAVHFLETDDENVFTQSATGPLAEHLRTMNVWDDKIPASGWSPIRLLQETSLLTDRTLLVHANYAKEADIVAITQAGASVALCPRTHYAFGHPPHPLFDMLRSGINVCIGTDSLASNPDLSVLGELRLLRQQYPQLPTQQLLSMGTLNGARALGLDRSIGSLAVGKEADLTVIPLSRIGKSPQWDNIFDHDAPDSVVTMIGGHIVS